MSNRIKTKATKLPVPQTDAEAERMIAELGEMQRELAGMQTTHNEAIAKLEEKFGETVKASEGKQKAIIEGLSIWASANRERLTKDGKTKTVQLSTGTILWREGRFSVKHRPLKVDEVVVSINQAIADLESDLTRLVGILPALVAAKRKALTTLKGFLRYKTELNKDAMLEAEARDVANTLPGVTVSRGGEEFAVEPLAAQIQGGA